MGHSRGAAVANIVAGRLMDEGVISGSQLFAYTYACPSVSRNGVSSYSNIYNFNNPGDLITCVPLEKWGSYTWKRYGKTILLLDSHKENFKNRFRAEVGVTYSGKANADGGEMKLPAALTSISKEAFADNESIERLVIPESVNEIGERAFADCGAMTYAYIPENVTRIADDAFSGCEQLNMICQMDSAAQAYAEANGISYTIIKQ